MKRIVIITAIFVFFVLSSFVGKSIIFENKVDKNTFKESNIVDKKDISNELLEISNLGTKRLNIYVDNNTISFNDSNVYTDLNYSIYNKLLNSDKSKWSIITNNLIEEYTYNNNVITINDDNVNTISLSFIYNNDQYNLSLIKEDNYYRLVKSSIKLIHGDINSLWYTYLNDLETAVKAANKNDTIILYDNIEVNNTININKNINILSNPGNIYTIINHEGSLFKLKNKKIKLRINNIHIKTTSFIKGKYNKKNVVLKNTKISKPINKR